MQNRFTGVCKLSNEGCRKSVDIVRQEKYNNPTCHLLKMLASFTEAQKQFTLLLRAVTVRERSARIISDHRFSEISRDREGTVC